MQICLFLIGAEPLRDATALRTAAAGMDGLQRLIVHEAMAVDVDPRIAPAPDAPSCVLQWYFDELDSLEAASATNGPIHRALRAGMRDTSDAGPFAQQTMAVRTLAPPQARVPREDVQQCTYLVGYEGPAQDFNAWLTHYLSNHPPLMLQLPGLRELEIYTRLDSASGLPFAHATAMQRNKVVFDSATALADALHSPIRAAMRRDFDSLPSYSGATPHFAMRSTYGNLATH
jgi:uncharacterized protein (TIGR02118 family)